MVVGVLLALGVVEAVFEERILLILEALEFHWAARKLEAQLEALLEGEGVLFVGIHLAHLEVEK